jgi:gamma-D-glutamyl-L-lysine dipeptidyl-peptidase
VNPTPFAERWRERAAAANLDPRVHFWRLDPEDGRLWLRPGPALELARELAGEFKAPTPQYLILDEVEAFQVNAAHSALRREPSHAAEQISQLRLGQSFRAWTADTGGDWLLGSGNDGYPGWMRRWHLLPARPTRPGHVLTTRHGSALAAPAVGAALLRDLSFGTEIEAVGDPEGGFIPWHLPDGRRAWTACDDLAPMGAPEAESARETLLRRAERLLSVPYEWGGSSSRGFDCSGFVQTVFGSLGIRLPRDADLQAACGVERDSAVKGSWRAGDLVFYGQPRIDHVGILQSLEPLRLLHASGEVKIEDLGPGAGLKEFSSTKILNPFKGRG